MKCDTCGRSIGRHCKNCMCCYPEGDLHRDDCPTLLQRLRRRARELNG